MGRQFLQTSSESIRDQRVSLLPNRYETRHIGITDWIGREFPLFYMWNDKSEDSLNAREFD